MKISIVTPSYNQGAFIENCIISVLEQNYPDFEHIIMDGGSTDGTVAILKKYPHLIWVSEKDDGQSAAINAGFKKATGDIIGWLNTDETYAPGIFHEVANTFKKGKYDIIYGNYNSINNGKNQTVKGIRFIKKMLNWRQFINTLTLFLSKKIIKDGNYIDETYHAAMDKEYLLRLESKGYRYKYLNLIFGDFYWHEDNKSTKIRELQKDESRKIILKYFFKNNKVLFTLLFWPTKYFYDIMYNVIKRL